MALLYRCGAVAQGGKVVLCHDHFGLWTEASFEMGVPCVSFFGEKGACEVAESVSRMGSQTKRRNCDADRARKSASGGVNGATHSASSSSAGESKTTHPSPCLRTTACEGDSFVDLFEWDRNSCHWDSVVAAFIPIYQLGLVPGDATLTAKAERFFSLIRTLSDGIEPRFPGEVLVSERVVVSCHTHHFHRRITKRFHQGVRVAGIRSVRGKRSNAVKRITFSVNAGLDIEIAVRNK